MILIEAKTWAVLGSFLYVRSAMYDEGLSNFVQITPETARNNLRDRSNLFGDMHLGYFPDYFGLSPR